MSSETEERVVTALMGKIDPSQPDTLAFDFSTYQQFDPDRPVVTLLYSNIAKQGLGIVVWNLEPGQENDYHVHPSTEHVHIILAGEAEYKLGDRPPVRVRVGQAVMVPAKIPHGIRNVGTERCSYVAVNSPGDYQKIRVDRPA
jgi:quercetin dioxygenase-like cupin family protein